MSNTKCPVSKVDFIGGCCEWEVVVYCQPQSAQSALAIVLVNIVWQVIVYCQSLSAPSIVAIVLMNVVWHVVVY